MKKLYHLEYEETEQTFTDMFRIYNSNRRSYMYKMIVTFAGALVLAIMFIGYGFHPPLKNVMVLLVLWTLAYVIGYFLVKYVISAVDERGAQKKGKKSYQERVEKFGTDLKIRFDFYEDKFTTSFQDKKDEYSYKEVSRMFENGRIYGMVVGGVYGNKAMISFPAACLDAVNKDKFLEFMAQKCQNTAGGFKKV